MIDSIAIAFQNGYAYIRKHPQLLLTVALIAVIPLAFILSGQQFLNAARTNQEVLERERIGMFHDVFVSYLNAVEFDPFRIQTEIVSIQAQNPDIERFRVVREERGELRIIASLQAEDINTRIEDAALYQAAHLSPGTSIIRPTIEDGTRHWQSVRIVAAPSGVSYYFMTETSLAHIDALFSERIVRAYYWLFGILGVVLLLVLRHVRLIDYAYLYRETKHANEMKDLFTNMIAHELRAPLTSIRGYASMITEKPETSSEARDFAGRIERSAGRLALIVTDLLDVARIHSGKLSIKPARVDIGSIIVSVTDAMRLAAEEKHIGLASGEIPTGVYIEADEKRLYQALTNLVSNAIKYTKAGSISISLEERSDRIEIRVKDTGVGMSAEHQKQLFAPFFRIENTETEGTVGTGLGMWITKQLVELMHGSISVESIKGVGTHVVLTLPKQ